MKDPVESHWSYFKCDHSRHHFVVHRVRGYLPLKIVHFIMNMRTTSHAFYLSRHGQSEYNAIGRIGGDSGLSQHGVNYAKKLAVFVAENVREILAECRSAAHVFTRRQNEKENHHFI
jgi:Histidine phosphatase superfamily (branch 1)